MRLYFYLLLVFFSIEIPCFCLWLSPIGDKLEQMLLGLTFDMMARVMVSLFKDDSLLRISIKTRGWNYKEWIIYWCCCKTQTMRSSEWCKACRYISDLFHAVFLLGWYTHLKGSLCAFFPPTGMSVYSSVYWIIPYYWFRFVLLDYSCTCWMFLFHHLCWSSLTKTNIVAMKKKKKNFLVLKECSKFCV